MAPKRKREPGLEELDEFDLDTLSQSLRIKGGPDLVAKAILDLARNAGLTLKDLKKAKETLSAFASARWENVAPKFGLDPFNDTDQLDTFSVPYVFLPPSFHKNVMTASAQWLDVYQERGAQRREASRVRLMDAVCFPPLLVLSVEEVELTCAVACTCLCTLQRACRRPARDAYARDAGNLWGRSGAQNLHDRRHHPPRCGIETRIQEREGPYSSSSARASL